MVSEATLVWQVGRLIRGDDGTMLLEFPDPAACARCRSGHGCGAGQMARLFGQHRAVRLPAPAIADRFAQGWVRVGVDSRWLLLAAAAAYLLPLLAFIGGALTAGVFAGGNDAAALLGGLVASAGAWLALRRGLPGLLQPNLKLDPMLESHAERNHSGACRT